MALVKRQLIRYESIDGKLIQFGETDDGKVEIAIFTPGKYTPEAVTRIDGATWFDVRNLWFSSVSYSDGVAPAIASDAPAVAAAAPEEELV
jgi:hypothetical protein